MSEKRFTAVRAGSLTPRLTEGKHGLKFKIIGRERIAHKRDFIILSNRDGDILDLILREWYEAITDLIAQEETDG